MHLPYFSFLCRHSCNFSLKCLRVSCINDTIVFHKVKDYALYFRMFDNLKSHLFWISANLVDGNSILFKFTFFLLKNRAWFLIITNKTRACFLILSNKNRACFLRLTNYILSLLLVYWCLHIINSLGYTMCSPPM